MERFFDKNEELSFVVPTFNNIEEFKRNVREAYEAGKGGSGFDISTDSFYKAVLLGSYDGIRSDISVWERWKQAIDSVVDEIKSEEISDKEKLIADSEEFRKEEWDRTGTDPEELNIQ